MSEHTHVSEFPLEAGNAEDKVIIQALTEANKKFFATLADQGLSSMAENEAGEAGYDKLACGHDRS